MLCALMGLLGQGVRAAVGLKSGGAFNQTTPSQQSEFNAAYLLFSLMIGALAGMLAGLVIGPQNFNAEDVKTLLGVAASGYAGADFIENTYSIFFSGASQAPKTPSGAASAADVQTLSAHISNLNTSLSNLGMAKQTPSSNCTDKWWLTNTVLGCVRTWFVDAHKIAQPSDLDPTKKFTDDPYDIAPVTFLQLCNWLTGNDDGTPGPFGTGCINTKLAAEGCAQRAVLNSVWRQAHQGDVIDDFVTAVVNQILNPPAAGV